MWQRPPIDVRAHLRFAQLANAAYITDVTELEIALAGFGARFCSLVTDGSGGSDQGDHQAVICVDDDGTNNVLFRGTQIEDAPDLGTTIAELWDDLWMSAVSCSTGGRIAQGFDTTTIIGAVKEGLNPRAPVRLIGHSKGGSEAHGSRRFFPINAAVTVYSYGAPACADEAYWPLSFGPDLAGLYRVIHDADFAPGWGLDQGWSQPPGPAIFVNGVRPVEWYDGPPVYRGLLDGGLAPHSITGAYIPSLRRAIP